MPFVVTWVSEVEKGMYWGRFRKRGLIRLPTKNPAFVYIVVYKGNTYNRVDALHNPRFKNLSSLWSYRLEHRTIISPISLYIPQCFRKPILAAVLKLVSGSLLLWQDSNPALVLYRIFSPASPLFDECSLLHCFPRAERQSDTQEDIELVYLETVSIVHLGTLPSNYSPRPFNSRLSESNDKFSSVVYCSSREEVV